MCEDGKGEGWEHISGHFLHNSSMIPSFFIICMNDSRWKMDDTPGF